MRRCAWEEPGNDWGPGARRVHTPRGCLGQVCLGRVAAARLAPPPMHPTQAPPGWIIYTQHNLSVLHNQPVPRCQTSCERSCTSEAPPPAAPLQPPPQAMAAAKEQLRLFHTLDSKRAAAQSAAAAAAIATKQREAALAAGSSPRFPFHAISSRYDQATTALLLHNLAHGYATSGSAALRGFDRSGSGSGTSAEPLAAEGQLAAEFADRLVPGWWHLTRGLLWRWHLRRLMETPCWGVPGLSSYYRARAAWLREQIQLAIDGDGCRWVGGLAGGLGSSTLRAICHGTCVQAGACAVMPCPMRPPPNGDRLTSWLALPCSPLPLAGRWCCCGPASPPGRTRWPSQASRCDLYSRAGELWA